MFPRTITLASVLDGELQFVQSTKLLEHRRHGKPCLLVILRSLHNGLEDIAQVDVLLVDSLSEDQITCNLMYLLGAPEGAVSDVDIDGQSSAGSSMSLIGLDKCQ